MRLIGLLILLFWGSATFGQKVARKNVLFIGNSLTYYSDMPGYLRAMLRFTNEPVEVDVSAYPGMSLEDHLDNMITSKTENGINTRSKRSGEQTETEKKILSKKWDVVILQEPPIRVLISEARKRSTEVSIERLKKLIDNPACELILFKTWAPKSVLPAQFCYPAFTLGGPVNKETYCSDKFISIGELYASLSAAYDSVARATGIGKINMGDTYYKILLKYPAVELYDNDSHPTKLGAYLNACVFYKYLLDGKPAPVNYYGDLRKEDAILLQQLVN